jgi:hypothetical protein
MNITITRSHSNPSGTPGDLVVTNAAGETFTCRTLELPWRNNEPGVSCIMEDSYRATLWRSEHLDCDVLRLEDKHGRQNCLIHCGNFAGDVTDGMETQVQGCTLVGDRYGSLVNDDGSSQVAILDSRLTLLRLVAFVGTGEHTVNYQWAEGCEPSSNQT